MDRKDNPTTTTGSWSLQYIRVGRWLERITDNITTGSSFDTEYEDFLYAFFINCWHLKDWIANDSSLSINKDSIDKFCNDSVPLSACGDVANANKHLRLSDSTRDKTRKMVGGMIEIREGRNNDAPEIRIRYKVISESSGDNQDALELANDCMKEWEKYVKQENLK